MKYKHIPAALHNVAHKFTSAANSADGDWAISTLARRSHDSGRSELHVNLLTGTAHPEELLTPDLQHSVRWYAEHLDEMLRPLRVSRTSLTEVRLTIRFEDFADHEACYVCVVDATDDRGRNHSVRLDGRTPWTRSE